MANLKRRISIIALFSLMVLIVLFLIAFYSFQNNPKYTGAMIGEGRCSFDEKTPCPSNPNCCLPGEKCLSEKTGILGLGPTIYICCPLGSKIDHIAQTTVPYCKPEKCPSPGVPCVDLCCTSPNNICKVIQGPFGIDIKGQCSDHKNCDSSKGETECGSICCAQNEKCVDKHDPKDPSKVVFQYCTADSCLDPTPKSCSSVKDGDTYTICCSNSQECQINLNGAPYCYTAPSSPPPIETSYLKKLFSYLYEQV